MAAVGYSGGLGGGIRALEHLVQIATEVEAVPLRSTVVRQWLTRPSAMTASLRTP